MCFENLTQQVCNASGNDFCVTNEETHINCLSALVGARS